MLKSKQLNTVLLRCQLLGSKRQNPHDDIYLIDPLVLMKNLYSDEFNDKMNREILLPTI